MRAREFMAKQKGEKFMLSDEQIHVIKRAKIVTGASIHPDTGTLISWPFRMSSFLYMGVPLTVGLTMTPPTTFSTFLWQWLNQTYFAGLNFSNRNASNISTNLNVLLGFTAAAASGVFMAVFMRKLLGRYALRMNPGN
jgi:hypothetical protein